MKIVSAVNTQIEPGEDICRVKVWRPQTTKPTALPPLLICSRCGRIPPTIIKDCTLFFALDGRISAYFLCRLNGYDTLELVSEAKYDNW